MRWKLADRGEAYKPVLALTSGGGALYIGFVKWRNQLLALFCLLAFFAFGVFYFQYWVVQKPFGIIIFIAEGLDARTLAEARVFAKGEDGALALDSFPYTALLRNRSADSVVPDPAAAATALATGVKVPNGSVATNADGQPLSSLLELAHESGRVTGLISDGKITAPTAAAFYGHARSDEPETDFARQLSKTSALDVILGGGAGDFLPAAQGGKRSDDLDLVSTLREADFVIVESLAELEEVPRWPRAKLFGLFTEKELPFASDAATKKDQPTLPDMVRRGIELLQFHRGGYLLVIDASLMRKARKEGQGESRIAEVMEFNRAVSVAMEYAGKKSAIIVCGDVADRSLNPSRVSTLPYPAPQPTPQDRIATTDVEVTVARPAEPTDLTGLQFTPIPGINAGTDTANAAALFPPVDFPAAIVSDPTDVPEDVLAFGMGLGAEELHGTRDSTAIFEIIRDNL